MSRLLLMEVAMKEEIPELYEIYFGGSVPIYYDEKVPFIVVGTSSKMSKNAAVEFIRGCENFKEYHKELFGIEVKSFVTDEKNFKNIKNWWNYFHPNGIYG
ncbi:hypothetical protein [Neobacillus terrae]|uniref:hypothetical protein n=1 Tax=Neobacillus terrae TaxID=3034837 RepID=UPI00140A1242|nr:hypothetical protein [Neobacillus terrae]NHM29016.1 hypothetical protein [Neobacillus terrae]